MQRKIAFAAAVAASFTIATETRADAHSAASVCDGYSATDVDGNGYISKIEMNAYAERQAKDMDADSSGTVSRDEYVNCSKAMMDKDATAYGRSEDDMTMLDSNTDGSVDSKEYMDGAVATRDKAGGGDAEAGERMARLLFMPDGMEADMQAMSLEEYASRAAMLFVRLDQDQSGALTQEEFMERAPPMVDISETLNREFDDTDSDGSGDLTTTELIAANEKRSENAMAQAEADTGEKQNPDVGAPVVYYTYPSTM